jgi:hypothetical protein
LPYSRSRRAVDGSKLIRGKNAAPGGIIGRRIEAYKRRTIDDVAPLHPAEERAPGAERVALFGGRQRIELLEDLLRRDVGRALPAEGVV